MEEAVESPDVSAPEDTGGGEEPSTDLSADYIRDTISGATDKIPAAKYLHEQEEADKKQEKKQPKARGKQQPAAQQHEETAEEEAPSEDEQESEEAKSNAKWNLYRTAHKENPKLKAEIADLKQKVQQLGDTSEANHLREQVQHLSQEREQLLRAVEVGNVEAGYQWKQHIVEPLNRMWAHVQTIAKRNSLDPGKIVQYMVNGDDVGLDEYMAEARPGDKAAGFRMINDLQEIEERKEHMRENAHQLSASEHQQIMAQREAYQKHVSGQRESAVERIRPKIEERVLSLLPQDKRIDLQGASKTILDYDNWGEDVRMYSGFAAVVLPEILDGYKSLQGQLKAAKNELIRLRGGTPKIAAGSASGSRRAVPVNDDEDENPDLSRPIREVTSDMTNRLRKSMGFR